MQSLTKIAKRNNLKIAVILTESAIAWVAVQSQIPTSSQGNVMAVQCFPGTPEFQMTWLIEPVESPQNAANCIPQRL